MTKTEYYRDYIKPFLIPNDKPANRQMWSDVKDGLHKDGLITDKQVNDWVYPKNKFFTDKND